jgi:microcystin-dependent protein
MPSTSLSKNGESLVGPLSVNGGTGVIAGRYMGSTASGIPTSGTFNTGDFIASQDGALYICTAGGSPGTWKQLGTSATSTKTASFTLVTRTAYQVTPAAAVTATLPAASATAAGDWVIITLIDPTNGSITIAPNGADTIDAVNASIGMDKYNQVFQLISDGSSGWRAFRDGIGTASSTAMSIMSRDSSGSTAATMFKAGGSTGTTTGRYVGCTNPSGPPTTGTFQAGDYVVSVDGGLYVCTTGGSPGTWTVPNIPVGSIYMYGGSLPNGTLSCDGSAVSRTTYATLFASIGTTFGAGDGSTTFNLPNLKDSVPVGLDSGGGFAMGATGGSATHTHTEAAHTHPLSDNGAAAISLAAATPGFYLRRVTTGSWVETHTATTPTGFATGSSAQTSGAGLTGNTDSTTPGATGSASEYPPYQVVGFCIRYLAGPPTSGSWTVGALSISGVSHPSISFADTGSDTALIELASATNDGITGSAAGDLVVKSTGKIRFAPDGRTTSALVIGRLGIESTQGSTPDNRWHYPGQTGEPTMTQFSYDQQNHNLMESFGRIRFRLDEVGCVWLEGLLASGTWTGGTLFTLPVGYRPAYTLAFNCVTDVGCGKIQVLANGNVNLFTNGTAGSYISLTGVTFMAEDLVAPAWTSLTSALASGWSAAGSGLAPPRAFIDDCGDMHLSGAITKAGSSTTLALTLPSGFHNTDLQDLFLVASGSGTTGTARLDFDVSGGVTVQSYKNGGNSSSYVSLEGIVLPSVNNGWFWSNPTMANSWVNYDAAQTTWMGMSFGVNKNGIGSFRGLIKSGTVSVSVNTAALGALPKNQLLFILECQTGLARSDIQGLAELGSGVGSPGSLSVGPYFNSGTNGYVSLSALRWNSKQL